MTTYSTVEPKVLSIFRSFVGMMLVLSTLTLVSSRDFYDAVSHPGNPLLNLIFFVFLFLYLLFGQISRFLGRLYLPLALTAVTIALLVNQRVTQNQMLMAAKANERWSAALSNGTLLSLGDSWVIFLFLPLVLIAWQYRFRSVVIFSLGTAFFDVLLTLKIFDTTPDYVIIMANTILSRFIAFMVIGFIVVKLVAHQQKQQAELTIANQKLSNYARILEKFSVNVEQLATSYERNRLARELHDTLAHTLSALSVQLEATDTIWNTEPDQAQQMLQKALSTTRAGLIETRRALQALRASPLEDLGLSLAVRGLAESIALRESFSIDLDIPPQFNNLSPQFEQTIYRVVQESFENISRHANARHISLALTQEKNIITALIADDGIGFNLQDIDQERRLGLKGMRERVEMLGGTLDIQSSIGQGTAIRLVMCEAVS